MEAPHLVCAAICERTLEERDGVLTLIRVIDRIKFSKKTEGEKVGLPGLAIIPRLVVMLRAGDYRGAGKVHVEIHTPRGGVTKSPEVPVEFREEGEGCNVIFEGLPPPTESGLPEIGVFWYRVYFNGRELTRTPLRLTLEGFEQSTPSTPDVSKADQTPPQ